MSHPIWSEVAAELQCFRGLSLLGISPWQTRWNEYVDQSNASLTGYGVRVAHWLREQVERAGKISERSRFKLQEFCRARESALASALLRRLDDCGWAVEDCATDLCDHWKVRSLPRHSLDGFGPMAARLLNYANVMCHVRLVTCDLSCLICDL